MGDEKGDSVEQKQEKHPQEQKDDEKNQHEAQHADHTVSLLSTNCDEKNKLLLEKHKSEKLDLDLEKL